jgi:hypothetical protein
VNDATNDVVDRMLRGLANTRKVIAALVVLSIISLSTVGYLMFRQITHPTTNAIQRAQRNEQAYVQLQLKHECTALELLTATPVPYPANPKANPSRVTTYNFYEALLYWERADGCTAITVHSAK